MKLSLRTRRTNSVGVRGALGALVAGLPTTAGRYKITCDLSAGSNYDVTVADAYLTIAKKDGVVTPDPQTITYGDADPTFPYSVSGVKAGEGLATPPTCGVAGAHADAGTYTITCSGGADPNYALTQTATATLTVAKKAVTVTANNASKVYGTADPAFTATTPSGVGFTGGSCSAAGAHTNAGEYPISINAGTVTSKNYTVAYVPGVLTVPQAPLPPAVAYSFALQQPLNADGSSVVKGNATVPVKSVLKANGVVTTSPVATFSYARLAGAITGDDLETMPSVTPSSGNRFAVTNGQYHYNWPTKGIASGTYRLKVTLDAGATYSVNVSLK